MDKNNLSIQAIEKKDAQELTALMIRSFDDDSHRHLAQEHGGPPGYDTGDFIRKNAYNSYARAFKACLGDTIVGCIIVFPRRGGHNVLGCMFTDPAMQRLGIGKALFAHVEKNFPARSWSLETPAFARSNHVFYEQHLGFSKIGETDPAQDPMIQFLYRKEYAPA